MVAKRGLDRYMARVEEIAREAGTDKKAAERILKVIQKDMDKRRRQKAPPPPEGGISVRESERKYGISRSKVSRLAQKGKVKILARVKNWLYIDESSLIAYLDSK